VYDDLHFEPADDRQQFDAERREESPFVLRKPCVGCGNEYGRIETRSGQDCVFCDGCNRFQYNAPRTETGRAARSVSTVHSAVRPKQRARILLRSNGRCELCGRRAADGALHVGHILSVQAGLAGGLTEVELNDDENLVALCEECNLGIGAQPMPLRFVVRVLMERIHRQ
jgi:5-methylcytosine-specific restriction endonuclease McrA